MQLSLYEVLEDNIVQYKDKKVMIGLSGGINSMAILCYLVKYMSKEDRPKTIYLFYAHFDEHSPQTYDFVLAGVEYAKHHFEKVIFEYTDNSILDFFVSQNMIPHPSISPCTRMLKVEPILTFAAKHGIEYDLVGYVRGENKRIKNQRKRANQSQLKKETPISHLDDNDCFSLVKSEIGWFPDIYDLKWDDDRIIPFLNEIWDDNWDDKMKKGWSVAMKYATKRFNTRKKTNRVFGHNNCLPCKNMGHWEMMMVECFYPELYAKSQAIACQLGVQWGRDIEEVTSCTYCEFD